MLVYFFFCLLLVDLSDFFEDFVLILPEEFPKPGAAGSIPAGGALILKGVSASSVEFTLRKTYECN